MRAPKSGAVGYDRGLDADRETHEEGPAEELLPELYGELRALAARYLSDERTGHTLQPTAIVHEAYLRLAGTGTQWQNRGHFFSAAATAMRRILINHARDRGRQKRGGGASRITLDRVLDVMEETSVDAVLLDDALTRLGDLSPRQGRVVELRVFAGLTIPETANVLELSETTIKAEWGFARAWLKRELSA